MIRDFIEVNLIDHRKKLIRISDIKDVEEIHADPSQEEHLDYVTKIWFRDDAPLLTVRDTINDIKRAIWENS